MVPLIDTLVISPLVALCLTMPLALIAHLIWAEGRALAAPQVAQPRSRTKSARAVK